MYEEEKLAEAEYFLIQMERNKEDEKAFQYNLSAFLAASRSVLLYAKEEVGNKPNARAWYTTITASKPILKFFGDQRNTSIHRQPVSPIKELQIDIEEALHLGDAFGIALEHGVDGLQGASDWPFPSTVVTPREAFVFDFHGREDADTLCRFYLNELRKFVSDGQANGFLTLPS